ncbi:MAG: AAA family ATPase [Spirulina sp. SIO3F2]|nr:AAA family ATPase [Spirulina sp. SIO3F2]
MMIPLNPYIAGNPVGGGEAFIGRADVLREVLRMLSRPSENALLLYGQRRIGKTSVLQELRERLPTEGNYHPVYFDLQDQASVPVSQLLRSLAQRICQELELSIPELDEANAEAAFQETFLPEVLDHFPEESQIVLLLDEFDVLDNPSEGKSSEQFFPYLRNLLMAHLERLQFVFVIGRRPEDLTNITNSVFKGIRSFPVSLLTEEDTGNLVCLSEKNESLLWSDDAVKQVYALTGGHPFLTQQLCQEVWEAQYEDDPEDIPTVESEQVHISIAAALNGARQALEWLWKGLAPAERIVAAALAEAGPRPISQEILEQYLQDSGIRILIGELQNAPRVLEEWDLITAREDGFCFCVELLRQWIAERKPLSRVQEDIDRIQPMAESLFQAAYSAYYSSDFDQAIVWLEQSIGFNPNHIRANQLLAEIFLAQENLEEARRILESLYAYQPRAAKPRLIQVLLNQASNTQVEKRRLARYERILQIEPRQVEAWYEYQKIWLRRGDSELAHYESSRNHDSQSLGILDRALYAFKQAKANDKAEYVKLEIEKIELQQHIKELSSLEKQENYREALELGISLHQHYPSHKNELPDLKLLKSKFELFLAYDKATEALRNKDFNVAQRYLIEVIKIDPEFKDTAYQLYITVQTIKNDEVKKKTEVKKKPDVKKNLDDSDALPTEEIEFILISTFILFLSPFIFLFLFFFGMPSLIYASERNLFNKKLKRWKSFDFIFTFFLFPGIISFLLGYFLPFVQYFLTPYK